MGYDDDEMIKAQRNVHKEEGRQEWLLGVVLGVGAVVVVVGGVVVMVCVIKKKNCGQKYSQCKALNSASNFSNNYNIDTFNNTCSPNNKHFSPLLNGNIPLNNTTLNNTTLNNNKRQLPQLPISILATYEGSNTVSYIFITGFPIFSMV